MIEVTALYGFENTDPMVAGKVASEIVFEHRTGKNPREIVDAILAEVDLFYQEGSYIVIEDKRLTYFCSEDNFIIVLAVI